MLSGIDDLDRTRIRALSGLYEVVDQLIKLYLGPNIHCYQASLTSDRTKCDTMVLGNLLKSASRNGIYPAPPPPYQDMSFAELAEKLRCLHVEGLCHDDYGYGNKVMKKHNLEERLSSSVLSVAQLDLKGFQIADYKGKRADDEIIG